MRWVWFTVVMVACGSTSVPVEPVPDRPAPTPTTVRASEQVCADVIEATAERSADGSWRVSATVRSGDTGWDKYADLWEVRVAGEAVAERVLAHPHETEQPFTRSLTGVLLPEGTTHIEVAARDSVAGFCGDVFELELPV